MHFLITGDSWSQGEWALASSKKPKNYIVVHKGLEQYMLDNGHIVTNVGRGGIDNCESLYQAIQALWSDIDHLIFFHTDVLRSCDPTEFQTDLPMDLVKKYQTWNINQLSTIRKDNPNLKITVIGGCGKFDPGITSYWDYCVPSVTELLVPWYVDNPFFNSNSWSQFILDSSANKLSTEYKSQILEIEELIASKTQCWDNNKDLFYPDGIHPNRHAHKMLFEHLVKVWDL
jgi:hypothetical protein